MLPLSVRCIACRAHSQATCLQRDVRGYVNRMANGKLRAALLSADGGVSFGAIGDQQKVLRKR
jgi:hypothetical protein